MSSFDGKEYVITDGSRFIKRCNNGRYTQVNNQALADIYNTKKSASNVMLNSIPKGLSNGYYVAEIIGGDIVPCDIPSRKICVKYKDKDSDNYSKIYHDTQKWIERVSGLENIFEDAEIRGEELNREISKIDSKIVDLEHYIELSPSLNARDGYKVYRKLKDLLCRRRDIKNEIKVVSAINKNKDASTCIKNILSTVKQCEKQKYHPRILDELFIKGIDAMSMEVENNERKNNQSISCL